MRRRRYWRGKKCGRFYLNAWKYEKTHHRSWGASPAISSNVVGSITTAVDPSWNSQPAEFETPSYGFQKGGAALSPQIKPPRREPRE